MILGDRRGDIGCQTGPMPRQPRHLRLLLIPVLPLMASVGLGVTASANPGASGCVVRIARFAFQPSTAAEGAPVVLHLAVHNCTGHSQTVTLTQFGTEPLGCPVIDPIARTVTIKGNQSYRSRSPMTAAPCKGTEQMTLQVSQRGTQLARQTADLIVT